MISKNGKASGMALRIILQKGNTIKYGSILGKRSGNGRSTIVVRETKKTLEIKISSLDATALRASANSVLRSLQVAESVSKA